MAEEYHQQQSNMCCQNWWSNISSTNNSSGRGSSRYKIGIGAEAPSIEHDTNNIGIIMLEDSVPVSGTSSSMIFLNSNQKMPGTAPGGLSVDTNLQHIGLGLSSQGVDWDHILLRGAKVDQSSFRSMLEEDHISSSSNFRPDKHWKPYKTFTALSEESSLDRSIFSLDQPQFSSSNEENSTITCHNLPTSYIENLSSIVYGGSPSGMLQGLFGPNNNQIQQQQGFFYQRGMEDNSYDTENYGMNSDENQFIPPYSFSSDDKLPQFLSNSPTKKQQLSQNQLQFSNNTPYWNVSPARLVPDVRASFMPSPHPQFPMTSKNSSFDEKPKNNLKVRHKHSSVAAKKSGAAEASTKRSRNESSPSTLPHFKVKKQKMGERIIKLQQLVSPFGKIAAASVLTDTIDVVGLFTTPYMKNAAMMQHHHQHLEKSITARNSKGTMKDLRSRGLCLVPISSTFPVINDDISVDYWTPTFGGPPRLAENQGNLEQGYPHLQAGRF